MQAFVSSAEPGESSPAGGRLLLSARRRIGRVGLLVFAGLALMVGGCESNIQNSGPPALSAAPTTLAFGNQAVGSKSSGMVVKVTNDGGSAAQITQVIATSDFSGTDDCVGTLSPNTSCTITMYFTPTASGLFTGNMEIVNNTSVNPILITLTGTGD